MLTDSTSITTARQGCIASRDGWLWWSRLQLCCGEVKFITRPIVSDVTRATVHWRFCMMGDWFLQVILLTMRTRVPDGTGTWCREVRQYIIPTGRKWCLIRTIRIVLTRRLERAILPGLYLWRIMDSLLLLLIRMTVGEASDLLLLIWLSVSRCWLLTVCCSVLGMVFLQRVIMRTTWLRLRTYSSR